MKTSKIFNVNEEEIKKQILKIEATLILFVIDSEIQKQYPELIKNIQQIEGKRIVSFVSANGERAKTFEEYENGINFFLEKNIHRNAHLIAMGGGAVTDLAGFIASTILRGISWKIGRAHV